MSISFQLNLTPNQIEFLQAVDLYADDAAEYPYQESHSIIWSRKLQRQGLIKHIIPKANERYAGQFGENKKIVKAYRITDKGRSVLALIEHDVEAFMNRQREYKAKKRRRA